MSNALAIAAVTATVRNLLTHGVTAVPDLADTVVTTTVPDGARSNGTTANQINLFLYQAVPNAAWRNADLPNQTRPGETGAPPLALNLYYLLTTYGRDNDVARPFSQELLGRAMSILHDHPLLGAAEIAAALPGNDLSLQFERIRFSLQPLGVEEIYRLWTGFQTPYRTSVAYEASVVLIDSQRETRTPLPVLRRGANDSGAAVQAGTASPLALLRSIEPNIDVTVGDTLTLTGANLSGGTLRVNFAAAGSAAPRSVAALPGATDTVVKAAVPNDPAFAAGVYGVSVSITSSASGGAAAVTRVSNDIWLPLAPQIASGLPANVSATNGSVSLTIGCTPPVQPGQRVALLFGDREIHGAAITAATSTLTFTVDGVAPGPHYVRLRVDGADSTLLVDRTAKTPVFDAARRVTVT